MRWIVFLLLFSIESFAQNTFPAIGLWREHLPYQSTIDVTASDKKIYCATPFSLFSVDVSTKEIQRFSKVSGLSETGISCISYDGASKKLLVAYNNSNIDVLDQNSIRNIPDLLRKNISGDKTIYQIYPDNNLCYLATGLGVLVVDEAKLEIKDSWFIGNSGGYVKTNGFTKNNNFFYAATDEGLKKISTTNSNPADFHNWQNISGTNGLSAFPCKAVVAFQNKTIALQNDSLFVENANAWNLFFANASPVISINVSGNKLFVCQRQNNGASQVIVLNNDGTIAQTIQQPNIISFPEKAISVNNDYWIADLFGGLSHWAEGTTAADVYKLNSPADIALGEMKVYNNVLYATAGTVNSSWNYQYNRSGIFQLQNGTWTNISQYYFPQLDTLMDFITVAVDPHDETVWAGSYGGGLLHIKKNNQFEIFKQNSPIGAAIGDPTSYRVSGLTFDANNNLWISNFGSDHELQVLKKDGTWKSFIIPFLLYGNGVSQIIVDDANQKWMVSPFNGLIVFNDNNTIDNTGDDKWKLYQTGTGSGNLPSNNVLCIAKDKSGFIWAGTSNGVGIFQCIQDVFASGCDAVLPITTENGFANYLFKGQEVRYIAIDGADRKWMATATGAWLISAEGDKVIEHFTQDNSPLLSDDVRSIAINGQTGEVFFATTNGICSYRSTATEASETKNNVLVFPNPVPPSFNGNIGIRGLPENSIVKITETNGRLVYQTRSLGGQAVWNGKDYNGRQVSSGIYLVIAEDDAKQEKVVAKIVFISR